MAETTGQLRGKKIVTTLRAVVAAARAGSRDPLVSLYPTTEGRVAVQAHCGDTTATVQVDGHLTGPVVMPARALASGLVGVTGTEVPVWSDGSAVSLASNIVGHQRTVDPDRVTELLDTGGMDPVWTATVDAQQWTGELAWAAKVTGPFLPEELQHVQIGLAGDQMRFAMTDRFRLRTSTGTVTDWQAGSSATAVAIDRLPYRIAAALPKLFGRGPATVTLHQQACVDGVQVFEIMGADVVVRTKLTRLDIIDLFELSRRGSATTTSAAFVELDALALRKAVKEVQAANMAMRGRTGMYVRPFGAGLEYGMFNRDDELDGQGLRMLGKIDGTTTGQAVDCALLNPAYLLTAATGHKRAQVVVRGPAKPVDVISGGRLGRVMAQLRF